MTPDSCQTCNPSSAEDTVALARAKLLAQPYRQLREIACECREGLLILRGVVASFYLKQVAQAALRGLGAVYEIENRVEVEYASLQASSAVD